ncbi:HNH endonuclease signature motif containing protein [Arthrobacter globiformis]|uniref:HNH endonuclease n=1 Tax=Arthrobacter globiformis TaxID=1665 RepID=A0A328HIF5_ARTGO|nr:HNH endonuclease signature motif containing protein [Arthrobacter globiformis]RAM37944.1 HNH endonuclease [Arthrobacter globiformis]
MEAIGEERAETAAGTNVSGFRAAALMRGRGLRSIPSAGSVSGAPILSDAPKRDTSGGGAAAGLTAEAPVSSPATADLKASLALLDRATSSAPEELAAASFQDAADFAELTEELSRRVEYLQLQAAAAVERTRTEAINAAETAGRAAGWTTGWGAPPEAEPATAHGAQPSNAATATAGAATSGSTTTAAIAARAETPASASVTAQSVPARAATTWSPADDGSRNTADFLRTRLRIRSSEARRRLALANATLPRTGLAGRPMPPACEETAAALTAGIISSRVATTITTALDKVRHIPDPDAIAHMEHTLTQTAIENDHDFLTRIAHRCIDALDQDGTEPSEENLRHRQGVFFHHKRGGLHHLEIRATTDQYEVLTTVMNTATNPRTTTPDTSGTDSDGKGSGPVDPDAVFNAPAPEPDLDRRTLAQQRLDGLVGASKAALAAGTLPTTGGLRPQVMVTIGYRDLLNSIGTTASHDPLYTRNQPNTRPTSADAWQTSEPGQEPDPGTETRQTSAPEHLTGSRPVTTLPGINRAGTPLFRAQPGTAPASTSTGSGTFTYTGPVTASTIRKIACDADIIPVLLGSEGRILDIGRTTRVFPSHIRKALNARDQGCAFPNCTIPASWCEAHHITYWSRGGPTSTDNGVLLCAHHHHLIHKEQWKIRVKNGIPWFIPPPHIDPRQQPRQNHHHKT